MKEITIPNDMSPFVVIINEQRYTYTPGETVSVPDEVYEIIKQQVEAAPVYDTTVKLETVEYKPEDAGKMSRIKEDGSGIEWTDIANIPMPSAANEGKTLVAKQTGWKKGDVIIPEQEVTTEADDGNMIYGPISNMNKDLFTNGTTCIAVFEGAEYVSTVNLNGGTPEWFVWLDEDDHALSIITDDIDFGDAVFTPEAGTYTLSLYVAEPVYEWVADEDPYPGYDVVVKLSKAIESSSIKDSDIEIVKGSYSSCLNRMRSGLGISVKVFYFVNNGDENYFTSYTIHNFECDEGYHNCLEFDVFPHIEDAVVRKSDNSSAITIYGAVLEVEKKRIFITDDGASLTAPWN